MNALHDIINSSNKLPKDRSWGIKHTVRSKNVIESLIRFKDYNCPTVMSRLNITNLHICGNIEDFNYKMIFFTTMYYSEASAPFFRNTLRVIASMLSYFHFRPVLFIEDPGSFIRLKRTAFIKYACNLGWTVLVAPHCNAYGFPVFKSMFTVTMATWKSEWHCYSNGDMLFDDSLLTTIGFVDSLTRLKKIVLIVGQRYHTEVNEFYI